LHSALAEVSSSGDDDDGNIIGMLLAQACRADKNSLIFGETETNLNT